MIWYLLYPFRGTTEAPVLGPTHPIRNAFTRYGKYTASHVVSTLLISVSVATILIYPFPFLYTNDFINGASNLPHHVWTDAQPLEERTVFEPDVIMRSIWVHGSYFKAIDKEVLLGALELQDALLGPTVDFEPRQLPGDNTSLELTTAVTPDLTPKQRDAFHVINGLTNESWFFHSPLQYWSCDSERIEEDDDILLTVNEKKTQPTSVNVTLRHSIVFSGKRFEDRRLAAADALVITLVHLRDSPVGRLWQRRVRALVERMADKWDVISPQDDRAGQLYEFQFRPMSTQDALLLGAAYVLVLSYFVMSLSKIRAVKSKVGLMVTVIAQIILSILSSFTICAIFKVDLSRIPRLGYPVVIFSMSLENIFRLINAVILTPSEDSASSRIGYAFGKTAHIAVASVAQNLLILYGLSRVVSPSVSAFCTFAAIALIFDFFYLSTFFLSVLSVDVRRTELSDALAKASIRTRRSPSEIRAGQTWMDAMLQGKIAMSTRIAGTIVMVGFVLIAQWHFFENESVAKALSRILFITPKFKDLSQSRSSLLDIHQARSPNSWLRLQDHETAQEVIHVIKPNAHSYVARVFDPYIFVRKGSDRMLSAHERLFLPAVYDFARHQSAPFLVTVLVAAACVRLLMNYLLWDQLTETAAIDAPADDDQLTVKTLSGGHALDVALLKASSTGHLVSVGLDRVTRVWDMKADGTSYVLGDDEESISIPFPVLAMCIEEDTRWLALLTPCRVLLWNLAERHWGPSIRVEPDRHRPEAFFFSYDDCVPVPPLILIRRDGVLIELRAEKEESNSFPIADDSVLVSVDALTDKGMQIRESLTGNSSRAKTSEGFSPTIMAATREGEVRIITQEGSSWTSSTLNVRPPSERVFTSIIALRELGFFLVVRSHSADLVDAHTQRAIYTFRVDPIHPKSLKCFHSKPRRMRCGSSALWSFTIAYLNAYTRDLVVQTYSPQNEGESLCFCPPESPTRKTCCPWRRAKETRRVIKDPGSWDVLPSGILMGVRKKPGSKNARLLNGYHTPPNQQLNGLRRRRHSVQSRSTTGLHAAAAADQDNWEVWMFSHFNELESWETAPLCQPEMEDEEHLFVTHLGPMAHVGRSSVAVGLSNVIKYIRVGHGQERFETDDVFYSNPGEGIMPAVSGRRRAKGGPSTSTSAASSASAGGLSSNSSSTRVLPSSRPKILCDCGDHGGIPARLGKDA